jgi:hypothetical protein
MASPVCAQCKTSVQEASKLKKVSHGYQNKAAMSRTHLLHSGKCWGDWMRGVIKNGGACGLCSDRASIDEVYGRKVKFENNGAGSTKSG